MAKKRNNEPQEEKELSYAEKLRRMEDDDRYLAEQRMQTEQKTGCLGMSVTFIMGVACIIFLLAGLGFFGYGIRNLIAGEGKTKDIITQIAVGAGTTAVTIIVWLVYRKNANN